ncbi:MAG: hypothetical protein EOP88_17030 [Verrucomicrobiaceae bacterium]|nr:MAG: hypothetical protein EOP88_17030 [Verrucomicrobiaceae bacterium]
MRLKWHRSRFFWFGFVGLMLLVVGWVSFPGSDLMLDYTTTGAPHGLRTGAITHSVGKDAGAVYFSRLEPDESPLGGFYRPPGWNRVSFPVAKDKWRFFPEEVCYYSDEPGIRHLAVASWLIVTIYVLVWLGGLVLWQRRKGRLARGVGVLERSTPRSTDLKVY